MKRKEAIEKKPAQKAASPMAPRLLPLKKAAEYLGVTVWTIRERIWAGDIPVVRFPGGRKMYIDRLDLDSFIERSKTVI